MNFLDKLYKNAAQNGLTKRENTMNGCDIYNGQKEAVLTIADQPDGIWIHLTDEDDAKTEQILQDTMRDSYIRPHKAFLQNLQGLAVIYRVEKNKE